MLQVLDLRLESAVAKQSSGDGVYDSRVGRFWLIDNDCYDVVLAFFHMLVLGVDAYV